MADDFPAQLFLGKDAFHHLQSNKHFSDMENGASLAGPQNGEPCGAHNCPFAVEYLLVSPCPQSPDAPAVIHAFLLGSYFLASP
jgi:hypothetical protein